MPELTQKEKNKLMAAASLIEDGDMAVLQKILEFNDAIEDNSEKIDEAVSRAEETVSSLIEQVESKLTTVENGKDYVLTNEDKEQIAKSIKVPIVEKITERVEVIKEVPVFNETIIEQIKEVAVLDPDTLPQYGSKFRDGLELLKDDERLDVSAIKGVDAREGKLSDSIINRAIGIVDQRTSFLINKVSNLSNRVDASSSGVSTFLGLTDTPSSYTGEGTKAVRVNAGETALEFFTLAGGGDALTADPLSQFASTTSLQLKGVISDETGSGALVFADTPTLVTPVLGVATATSVNKVAITAPATSATLTIADGATLTASATATVSGTNTGDQTSIVGISGTKAQFDTAVSDGNIMFDGDSITNAIGTAWRVFYSDGSGVITELALGADGTFLKSNGAAVAPSFATPAGSGDVSKVGTPVNNQIGVWTGDGTIEGDTSLTWDGTSFNIATAKNFQIAGGTVLADAAGTLTLSGIDAIDATTEATIEAAIDTLANLTSIQGRTVTLADAGANAIFGWDDVAGAYENLSQAEVLAVIGDSTATAKGVVELATDAETVTGTDTARATTPANITAKMAAPGAIGGTTASTATFTTLTVNTNANPDANDGAGLGTSALGWSDLFLAEGAVINWDNGDATLTQAGDVLTLAGADLKITTPGTAATSVATIDGTQTLTNKSIVATQLTGTAYTLPANNTNGTAAMTLVEYEDHPAATYTGDTWNSTPPTTAVSKEYSWSRIGKTVSLEIVVQYSGAGTTNTQVTFDLPSDCPNPEVLGAIGSAANEVSHTGTGRLEGSITTNAGAARCFFKRNAGNTAWQIILISASSSGKVASVNITYRTA